MRNKGNRWSKGNLGPGWDCVLAWIGPWHGPFVRLGAKLDGRADLSPVTAADSCADGRVDSARQVFDSCAGGRADSSPVRAFGCYADGGADEGIVKAVGCYANGSADNGTHKVSVCHSDGRDSSTVTGINR